jgi:pimeloyl-ACP methyl ester carboxylesterase
MPFAQVNGIRLRYESWGVGTTHVVFIHGLGSCAEDWFMQLPAFAADYHCIAIDLRGHGLSDKPVGEYSVALFATDIALLLASLGLAPAHIVGLSLGGMVAQQLGIAHPYVVRSLTLLNTLPGVWPPTPHFVSIGLKRLAAGRDASLEATARTVARSLFPDRGDKMLRDMVEQRLRANDPAAYRRATTAVALFRPGHALRKITCPVLIVAGDSDHVVPADYQARLRAGIPHARYETVRGGGHACNINYPDQVNAAILAFLAEQAASEQVRE